MESLFIEYDDVLIGRLPEVDLNNFYGSEASEANEKIALSLIRYCLEDILCWDQETCVIKFDEYIIREMKLKKIITYIDYPSEVPTGNPRYILSLLYPKRVFINQQLLCEETYRNVIESDGKQFPRDYFAGGIGFERFCFCLKYLIENYRPFSSVEEMYTFFASPEGRKFLSYYRLQTPIYQFSIDIAKAIRYITKEDDDGELYYLYNSFTKEYESMI